MNKILLISLTIAAMCMVAFVIMKHQQTSEIATPANSHFLTDNQRLDLAQQAQNGNADAAYQLALYYAISAVDLSPNERNQKALFWYEQAAQQQHILAIKAVIVLSIDNGDKAKAQYYFKQLPPTDPEYPALSNKINQ